MKRFGFSMNQFGPVTLDVPDDEVELIADALEKLGFEDATMTGVQDDTAVVK